LRVTSRGLGDVYKRQTQLRVLGDSKDARRAVELQPYR
jgi:hypothetical protein